jgi:transposase-like protein
MGRVCTICAHAERAAIDGALETKRSLREIAGEFGVSKTALHRHWRTHVSGQPALQPEESGAVRETTAAKRRPAILKWVAVGGIGVVVVWRVLVALRG